MAEDIVVSAVLEDGITPILNQILDVLTMMADGINAMAESMSIALSTVNDSVETVSASIDKMAVTLDEDSMAIVANTEAITGNTITINENNAALNTAKTSADEATASFSMLHGVMWLGMAAVIGGIGQLISGATQFDTAITQVQSLADSSGQSLQSLQDTAYKLSQQFGISATDVAKAMYQVYSSVQNASAQQDVLTTALKGSTAAGIDAASWTKILTSTYNVFGDTAGNITNISDELIKMITQADVPAETLTTSFARMLVPADASNVSLQEMAAAFDTLANQGDTARLAESSLGATISDVMQKPAEFAKQVEKLGGTFDLVGFTKTNDFATRLKILMDTAKQLNVPINDLFTQLSYGNVAALLTNKSMDTFNHELQGLNSTAGETNSVFDKYKQTIGYNWGVLWAVIQNTASQAIEAVRPQISGFLFDFATNVQNLTQTVVANGPKIKKTLEDLAPILITLGALIGGNLIVSGAEKLLGAFTGLAKLTGLPAIFNFLAGTEGKAGALQGIANSLWNIGSAAGNAVMQLQLWAGLNHPIEFLATVFHNLGTTINMVVMGAIDKVMPFIQSMAAGFIRFASVLSNPAQLLAALRGGLSALGGMFLDVAGEALPFIASLGSITAPILLIAGAIALAVIIFLKFRDQAMGVVGALVNALKPGVDMVKTAFETFLSGLKEKWDAIWPKLKPAIEGMLEAAKGMAPTFQVIGQVIGAVLSVIINIVGAVVQAFMAVLPTIAHVFGNIFNIIGDFGKLIQAIFSGQFGKIPGILGNIFSNILGLAGHLVASVLMFFGNLVQGIFQWIGRLPVGVIQAISNMVTGVINWFKNLFHQVVGGSIIPDMVTGIITWIAKLPIELLKIIADLAMKFGAGLLAIAGDALKKAGQIVSNIGGVISGLPGQALQWFGNMMTSAGNAITNALPALANVAGTIITALVNALASLPSKFADIGKNILESLGNAITNGLGALKDKVGNALGGFVNGVKGFFGISSPSKVFADIGTNLNEGLAQGIMGSTHLAAAAAMATTQKVTGAYGNIGTTVGGAGGNIAALLRSPGAGGGGNPAPMTINVTVNTSGGMSAGFQMLNPTDRRQFAIDIGRELGLYMSTQAVYGAGYTGH